MEKTGRNGSGLSHLKAWPVLMLLAIAMSLVSADNQIIINYGNQSEGGGCQFNYQCASNLCVGGTCIQCTSDGQCASNWCDSGTCRACSTDSNCGFSTYYCVSGVCASCPNDEACSTGRCVGGSCLFCSSNADCAASTVGSVCNTTTGACGPCVSDSQCAIGVCSAGRCKTCGPPDNVGCPNNWKCDAFTGKCGCRGIGQNCTATITCCSGTCRNNVCASCVDDEECPSGFICSASGSCVQPGAQPIQSGGVSLGTSTSGSSVSQTTYVSSIEVRQEIERKTAAPFITGFFGLSRLKTEAVSTCVRGAPCFSSNDCCGAECIDSACLCSKTACVTSGECCEGYCEGGYCRQPPSMSLFLAEALRRQITPQVGCVGLVDECDPSEQTCVTVCNGLTALLFLVAAGFGAFISRAYSHPVPGLFAGFSLILISLVTYPFVGILLGVIILGLILAK